MTGQQNTNRKTVMRHARTLDFAKLIGFSVLGPEIEGRLDFHDQTFGDKLGAKVGLEDEGIALLRTTPLKPS